MSHSVSSAVSRTMLAVLFVLALLCVMFVVSAPAAQAAHTPSQCNNVYNVAGQAIKCSYTVTNNVNGSVTNSTVVASVCHGAANDPATMVCDPVTTTPSDHLITAVSQCNDSGNGGGGTMECTVDVINNITGTVTPTPATVNQCNGSGGGGGADPLICSPYPASTTNATVTQCNGSANEGGGTGRVRCSVESDSTTTAFLSVTVNQCNGSENLGGSTVTCRAGLTDNITPPQPSPSPSPSVAPPDRDGDGEGDGAGPGDGSNGTPPDDDTTGGDTPGGDTPPDDDTTGGDTTGGAGTTDTPDDTQITLTHGDTTTNQIVRVPVGPAATGGGSTAGIENARLLLLGMLLLGVSVPLLVVSRRASARA
jgi:hypothetical protein